MIGAAHVTTTRQIHAARADLFAAEAIRAPYPADTPMLPLLGLSGETFADSDPLDWSRAAAGLED
jgi:hypothetical protein